jgi:hypothetical protein
VTLPLDNFPDAPYTVTVLANTSGYATWVGKIENHDITSAAIAGGIYLLVQLDPDGMLSIATKPGSAWDATWSPPVELERR